MEGMKELSEDVVARLVEFIKVLRSKGKSKAEVLQEIEQVLEEALPPGMNVRDWMPAMNDMVNYICSEDR